MKIAIKIIGSLLIIVFIATGCLGIWLWMQGWRPPMMRPTYELPPSPAIQSLQLTTIEKALPDGAWLVVGGKDLNKVWVTYQATNFHQSFKAFYSSMTAQGKNLLFTQKVKKKSFSDLMSAVNGMPLRDLFGNRFALASYASQVSTGLPSFVFVAAVSNKTSVIDDVRKKTNAKKLEDDVYLGGGIYSFAIDGYIAFSTRYDLIQMLKQSLVSVGKGPDLFIQASQKIPNKSSFYYAINNQAFSNLGLMKKMIKGSKGTYADSHIAWTSIGVYFKNGVWTDMWAQSQPGASPENIHRQPPRARRFLSALRYDTLLYVSFHAPIQKLADILSEAVNKEPKYALITSIIQKQEEKLGISLKEDIYPLLHDEIGLFVSDWQESSPIPPMALFVRVHNPLKVLLLLRTVLSEEKGWKKENGIYTYSPKVAKLPMFGSIVAACGLKKDILVLGLKPAVEKVMSDLVGPEPELFKTLGVPEAITSVQYMNIGRFFGRTIETMKSFLPLISKGKITSVSNWEDLVNWIPPSAAYSVNTNEGSLGRSLWPIKDLSREAWDLKFELIDEIATFLKGKYADKRGNKTGTTNKKPQIKVKIHSSEHKHIEKSIKKRIEELKVSAPKKETVPVSQKEEKEKGATKDKESSVDPWTDLVNNLKSDDWISRRDAALALGHVGGRIHIAPLKKLLNDSHPDVQQAAKEAIQNLESK